MTRTFIILMFFLLITESAFIQEIISEKKINRGWVEENLSGNVKMIKEVSVFSDSTEKMTISYYYYNKEGFLTKWNLKNENGFYCPVFEYDERGNIIKSLNSGDNNDFTITKYDNNDKPVESENW